MTGFFPRFIVFDQSFHSRSHATSHRSCVQVLLIWETVSVMPACRFPVVLGGNSLPCVRNQSITWSRSTSKSPGCPLSGIKGSGIGSAGTKPYRPTNHGDALLRTQSTRVTHPTIPPMHSSLLMRSEKSDGKSDAERPTVGLMKVPA